MTNQNYLKVAVQAAKESGKIFKKFFGKPRNVVMKGNNPSDLVTEIDKKIELLIRKAIRQNFPNHKIIGEEFEKDSVEGEDLFWVIDPVDGTTNFVYGLPYCCISIGLWDKKGPLVAVVYNPILGNLYSAVRGQGSKLNGKKIQVGKAKSLPQAMGTVGWGREKLEAKRIFSELIMHCFKLRIFASGAWQICLVASGNLDFFASRNENIWDYGAAALFVSEAGGKVTDIKGKPITPRTRSIIASNGKIHKELVKKLA